MDRMDAVNHLKITCHPNQIQSTLRALLHAIFFHRLLDNVEPDTIEILDTHIASLPNPGLDKEVNTKVEEFYREYVDRGVFSGEIAVVFLQRKPKKGWFAVTEELIPWEEHLITLSFPPVRYGSHTPPNGLPLALLQLLTFCAEKKSNIPPLIGSEGTTNISYQILISPPPPSELFSPSPPLNPTRLTSPPPAASTTTTAALVLAKDRTMPLSSAMSEAKEAKDRDPKDGHVRRDMSPVSYNHGDRGGALGYFEQAKDGLRAVGAKAGAVAGWSTGRGGFGRP